MTVTNELIDSLLADYKKLKTSSVRTACSREVVPQI